MGIQVNELTDFLTVFFATPAMAAFSSLRQIWDRLMALLQGWVANFNIPLLKYYSLLIEAKLRNASHQLLGEHLTWILLAAALAAGVPALWMLWRLLGSGQRVHRASFRRMNQAAGPPGKSLGTAARSYLRSALDLAFEGLLLVCAATVLTGLGFIWGKFAWYSYLVTPIGRLYPYYFPERAQIVNAVLGQDLFLFPLILTGLALVVGLLAGTVCRLLHVTRYGYKSRGLLGRIVLFALPLAAATAVFTQAAFAIPHWGAAYGATLLPTLLVFSFCFKATGSLVPELGTVFSSRRRDRKPPPQVLFLQHRNAPHHILEFDPLQARLTGRQFPAHDGIAVQGQFVTRRGHAYVLYRYGHDMFFQVDDLELRLSKKMSAKRMATGRFRLFFQLTEGETRLFRLTWSKLIPLGAGHATSLFFESFQSIMQDRAAFEDAYTDQWDFEEESPLPDENEALGVV
jgi:hypothetical protein